MSEVCTIFLKGKQWGHNLNEIAFRFSFSEYYEMRQISSGPFFICQKVIEILQLVMEKKYGKKPLLKIVKVTIVR